MCFICDTMDITTQLELCSHDQTANATYRVESWQFLKLNTNLATYFLTFYCVPF